MTDLEVIKAFHGLYAGSLAQKARDSGNHDAMPPWAEVFWLGKQVVKCPLDLWVYQEIILETKPDLIVETGTSGGGSAFFFATLFDLIGNGQIVTVDTVGYPELWSTNPRITYLTGDSTSTEVSEKIKSVAAGKRVMVSLDSLHTYDHVKKELDLYGNLTSPGCYLVVEDTGWGAPGEMWANHAAAEFLDSHLDFQVDTSREKHLLTSNRGGWLRRSL